MKKSDRSVGHTTAGEKSADVVDEQPGKVKAMVDDLVSIVDEQVLKTKTTLDNIVDIIDEQPLRAKEMLSDLVGIADGQLLKVKIMVDDLVGVVDELALKKTKIMQDTQSRTNNPNINYPLFTFSDEEKKLVELNCFRNGIGISFDGAYIENGILIIRGNDTEDNVNTKIKLTHHEGFIEESGKKPIIKKVLSGHEWFRREGIYNDSYEVPYEVTILWE